MAWAALGCRAKRCCDVRSNVGLRVRAVLRAGSCGAHFFGCGGGRAQWSGNQVGGDRGRVEDWCPCSPFPLGVPH